MHALKQSRIFPPFHCTGALQFVPIKKIWDFLTRVGQFRNAGKCYPTQISIHFWCHIDESQMSLFWAGFRWVDASRRWDCFYRSLKSPFAPTRVANRESQTALQTQCGGLIRVILVNTFIKFVSLIDLIVLKRMSYYFVLDHIILVIIIYTIIIYII